MFIPSVQPNEYLDVQFSPPSHFSLLLKGLWNWHSKRWLKWSNLFYLCTWVGSDLILTDKLKQTSKAYCKKEGHDFCVKCFHFVTCMFQTAFSIVQRLGRKSIRFAVLASCKLNIFKRILKQKMCPNIEVKFGTLL